MVEKRTIPVAMLVFTSADLLKLAKCVSDAPTYLPVAAKTVRKRFSIAAPDNVTLETDSYNDLVYDDRFSSRTISGLDFTATTYEPESRLHVRLSHGNTLILNEIIVESVDRSWVTTVADRVQQLLRTVKPQNRFVYRYGWIIHTLLAISIGSILVRPVLFFLSMFREIDDPPKHLGIETWAKSHQLLAAILIYAMIGVFWWGFGMIPAEVILHKLKKLWPSVELQAGPEHLHVEKRRRAWLAACAAVALIPIVVNILTTYLT